jgi:hypothetical protein
MIILIHQRGEGQREEEPDDQIQREKGGVNRLTGG